MVHLIVAVILTTCLVTLNRRFCKYPSIGTLGTMLLFGSVYGLLLDYFLGYRLGMWYYVHHAYYNWDYYAFLIPAWAMIITCFALFYNLLSRLIPNIYLRLLIYFTVIPVQQEFMGISQGSWVYMASPAIIGVGWIILLESCVVFNWASFWMDRRMETKE